MSEKRIFTNDNIWVREKDKQTKSSEWKYNMDEHKHTIGKTKIGEQKHTSDKKTLPNKTCERKQDWRTKNTK